MNTYAIRSALFSTVGVALANRLVGLLALTVWSAGSANASLVQFSDRTTFEAQGTIAENYGFEDWGSTGSYAYPGDPYTAHGVTYTSLQNLIVKPDSVYHPLSNIITSNWWTPISGSILSAYDMLGFDLGHTGFDSLIDFSITTNVGFYAFTGISVPNVSTSMAFFGFIASPGELITRIDFASQSDAGSGPSLDNVTLGDVTAIPEPQTIVLLGLGLLIMGARRLFPDTPRGLLPSGAFQSGTPPVSAQVWPPRPVPTIAVAVISRVSVPEPATLALLGSRPCGTGSDSTTAFASR